MKVCDLVHIPPNNLKEPPPRDEPIPSSIWALDFKFQTLALACNHGRIEVKIQHFRYILSHSLVKLFQTNWTKPRKACF